MIYAMSDIHGCIEELLKQMEHVDLSGENRLVFLGDYIDYGHSSYQVLKYIRDLQAAYGADKVIVLKGNHEAMFLEWVDEYKKTYSGDPDFDLAYNDWLRTDLEHRGNTIKTFISEDQMDYLNKISRTGSLGTISREAVRMILDEHKELINWIRNIPSFYETDAQIFVHAGVDEEAGEYWKWGTSDDILLWKFPATKGNFCKTIVAGHVGTGTRDLAGDHSFHDVYYDGESHYYIDGSVYKHGKLLLLAYDEEKGEYYQVENGKMILIRPFIKYR